ncbi:amidohydrolase [Pseudomonas sp. S9]|uniref:amidohydrolase n=1 Tax=Pseudomonas sp. S9 TaxID=686578 RepID=UPI0002557190|nr:amidohydrolase [Pseudomonas sp. S9]
MFFNKTTVLLLSIAASFHAYAATVEPDNRPADLILQNGKIYTGNSQQPWAEAIAIKAGKIIAIGGADDVMAYRNADTSVVDLDKKMAMPGINDAHAHPTWGGLKQLFQCNFPASSSAQQIKTQISACIKDQPQAQWIRGGQWTAEFFQKNAIGSPRKWLDAISGDKAILLTDDTGHNLWANSKAMALLNIKADTQAPKGSTFEKNSATGDYTGILLEANGFIKSQLSDWSDTQYLQAAEYAINLANSVGITGIKDADANENVAKAYYRLDQKAGLNAHVGVAIRISDEHRKNIFDMPQIMRIRDKYRSRHVNTRFAKIYLDGVPTAARTAAMISPYKAEENSHKGNQHGHMLLNADELKSALVELDKQGFTVKIHAAGDQAIRSSLDAIEAMRKVNGSSGLKPELAHAEFIDPVDLPRFAQLNATADFSPYIWYPSLISDAIESVVGARAQKAWPARDLLDSGATIIAGSDWPSVVPDLTPWNAIEALVTRRDPSGQHAGALWPEQAITLEEALKIFTKNGAQALGADELTGSLEVGKAADIIVLNQNLFEVPVDDISETRILSTYFEGNKVYSRQ